jgi:ABC-type uncharacterized transport system permease subunit
MLVILGAATGIFYLAAKRERILVLCRGFCAAALAAQLVWLIQAGFTIPYCALLDPWGVMAVVTIAGISTSWWAGRRYHSPRLFIGVLALLSLALGIGRAFLPEQGSSSSVIGWRLAFHVLTVILGYSILAVGCVTGVLILLRSRILKSTKWMNVSEIPWPSLIALDRIFVRSIGLGILLMAIGIFMGMAGIHDISREGPWYADTKVLLTFLSFILYGAVWYMRRRQGFSTALVVGVSTLGFVFIFVGLLVSGLFEKGFHQF